MPGPTCESICPAITAGPMAPGRELPVYQPATAVDGGTASAPAAVSPRWIRLVCTPMAGIVSAERADLAARKSAAAQLLKNPRIKFSAADAALFRAGDVDSRLLATLAALSTQFTLRVTAFGDSSPGAPLLYRQVTVANDGKGSGTAALAAALAMVNAQEGPYLPAHAAIVRLDSGQTVLLIGFAAPNPLGLLTTVLTADVREGVT